MQCSDCDDTNRDRAHQRLLGSDILPTAQRQTGAARVQTLDTTKTVIIMVLAYVDQWARYPVSFMSGGNGIRHKFSAKLL